MSKSEQKDQEQMKRKKAVAANSLRPKKVAVEELFVEGEDVVITAKIHDAIYWKSVAVFIISLLVAVFLVIEIGALLAFVSVLMFVHALFKKEILQLVVTNKRIFVRYGILQVDVVDIRFDKIESVELERMLPGFIFGYSNVVIMGTGNRYIVIPYVRNALNIRRAYNKITLERPSENRERRTGDRRVEGQVDLGRGRRSSD